MPSIHAYRRRALYSLLLAAILLGLGYHFTNPENLGMEGAGDGALLVCGLLLLFNAGRNFWLYRLARQD